MDALSEVLRLARLSGAVLVDATAHAPWCVSIPSSASRMYAHVILEGEALLKAAEGEPIRMAAGDVCFLPRGDAHFLASDLAIDPRPLASVVKPATPGEPAPVVLGGRGRATRFATLAFTWDRHLAEPLASLLPAAAMSPLAGSAALAWLADSLGLSLSGNDAPRQGGEATRSRLAELVLVEALRRHVERQPRGGTGWLAALNDRHVGAALALMHGRPGENWTVERLGRQVGLSRSALAERFALVMGEPVIAFLSRLRLQLAAQELLSTDRAVCAIADDAGYEAVNSFSRAFKRAFGRPPSVWRRRARRRKR
jgi:AraC-like DNA-binding protein